MEADHAEWDRRVDALIAQDAHIITFRGAGTVNGIDPSAAAEATEQLRGYVSQLAEDGTTVALMFDGDEDNRDRPDVGAVFGALVDSLQNKPNVVALAAQKQNWYYPPKEGGPLETATGTPIETYVFPDSVEGEHAAMTQSTTLAKYGKFEEVFVGPAGPIAFSQLKDLSEKAVSDRSDELGPIPVTIIPTANNGELDQVFRSDLAAAGDDEAKRAKVQAKIDQRSGQPTGALYDAGGNLTISTDAYPKLALQVRPLNV